MFTKRFGLEIEFTGITRQKAAEVAAHYLGGTTDTAGDYYDTHKITAPDGRVWKVMYMEACIARKKKGAGLSPLMTVTVWNLSAPSCSTGKILTGCRLWQGGSEKPADLQTSPAASISILMDPATRQEASATSSTSSTRIMTCFISHFRLRRSGCVTVRKWTLFW